jgi:hypothetical protein
MLFVAISRNSVAPSGVKIVTSNGGIPVFK